MTQPKVFFLDDEDYAASDEMSYWVINSPLSDHKYVYRLNNVWSSNFRRSHQDHINIKKGHEFHHAMYTWYDDTNEREWYFLTNKGYTIPNLDSNSLFQEEFQSVLLPVKTKADFILFSDECVENPDTLKIQSAIKQIPGTMNISSYQPTSDSVKEALRIELLKSDT